MKTIVVTLEGDDRFVKIQDFSDLTRSALETKNLAETLVTEMAEIKAKVAEMENEIMTLSQKNNETAEQAGWGSGWGSARSRSRSRSRSPQAFGDRKRPRSFFNTGTPRDQKNRQHNQKSNFKKSNFQKSNFKKSKW